MLEQTDHHLIVGKDAQRFAWQMGFKIEDDLNTEESRRLWLEWKRRADPQHFLDPKTRAEAGYRAGLDMVAEGLIDRDHFYGTINCNGINAKGEICGVTTTSGLAWKIPGRVGDSPILGAGLYVDGEVGAAGSTGRGEANLFSLASFLIVEEMRRGKHPKDAGLEALKRIKANTIEKRLLNAAGQPELQHQVLRAQREGRARAACRCTRASTRCCDEKGPQTARHRVPAAGQRSALTEQARLEQDEFQRSGWRRTYVLFSTCSTISGMRVSGRSSKKTSNQ